MWFNNAIVYHYELDKNIDWLEALASERLKPCPPHARFTYGWSSTYNDELLQETAGCRRVCLGKEERLLPRSVITRQLSERVKTLEMQQGRSLKRTEKAQLAEDLEFELLPKSFCVQKRLPALFDSLNNYLIINTASNTQASQLTSLLRKSIPGIKIEPFAPAQNLALRFAQWITNPATLPSGFQLASDCLLFSLDNEKKRISCKGYELPAEEILTLLAQGLAAAEISLIWNERIQFTLTHDLVFKRLKSLDYLIDEFNEINELEEDYQQEDAKLVLLCGELRQLTSDLLAGLAIEEIKKDEEEAENISEKQECLI